MGSVKKMTKLMDIDEKIESNSHGIDLCLPPEKVGRTNLIAILGQMALLSYREALRIRCPPLSPRIVSGQLSVGEISPSR